MMVYLLGKLRICLNHCPELVDHYNLQVDETRIQVLKEDGKTA